jgi:hypothetical protein
MVTEEGREAFYGQVSEIFRQMRAFALSVFTVGLGEAHMLYATIDA